MREAAPSTMPQTAPNPNIKIVPSTMDGDSLYDSGRVHDHQTFVSSHQILFRLPKQPVFYQKESHYHFHFFISSLMKRIFGNFTP
jgi:hypothetical protein